MLTLITDLRDNTMGVERTHSSVTGVVLTTFSTYVMSLSNFITPLPLQRLNISRDIIDTFDLTHK